MNCWDWVGLSVGVILDEHEDTPRHGHHQDSGQSTDTGEEEL